MDLNRLPEDHLPLSLARLSFTLIENRAPSGKRSSSSASKGVGPWTDDTILLQHKFTHAYRVSQYLIWHVMRNDWVRLGAREATARGLFRLVEVDRPWMEEQVWLVTNQGPQQLNAAQVAQLYRQRWAVKGFFRWLKCLQPCRHWSAESSRGVAIQTDVRNAGRLWADEEVVVDHQLVTSRHPSRRTCLPSMPR